MRLFIVPAALALGLLSTPATAHASWLSESLHRVLGDQPVVTYAPDTTVYAPGYDPYYVTPTYPDYYGTYYAAPSYPTYYSGYYTAPAYPWTYWGAPYGYGAYRYPWNHGRYYGSHYHGHGHGHHGHGHHH
jgi:hypothetical protein